MRERRTALDVAERLRAAALALPGVDERETWGRPTFRVCDRLFLTLAPDGSTATMKTSPADQAALIAAEPDVFSFAAYLGRHGWVSVSLDRCDPDEVEQMVVDSWRRRAPRRLSAREVDERNTGQSGSPTRAGGSSGMREHAR
ncbi:MAG TPA: MmcQ/YjbR family DNA-binding protein [Acidimicrobiales bacterium]|nr:MmcQ/YjbR family DNA-binding protein [Acidimicrobiales bacterium]